MQRVAPGRFGQDAITDLGRLCEPHVIQVFVQPLELLRQRHFGEADRDVRILLPTKRHQNGQPRWRHSIGQCNAHLPVVAGRRLHTGTSLLQGSKHARHVFRDSLPARISRVLRVVRAHNGAPRSSSSSLIVRDSGD